MEEPGKRHFLLIAATEFADRLFGVAELHAEPRQHFAHCPTQSRARQEAEPRAFELAESDVISHGEFKRESFRLAVLAHHPDALRDAFGRRCIFTAISKHFHSPAANGI